MLIFIVKYWLEILFVGLSSGFCYLIKQYIGLKNGIKSLLRNEIVRIYEVYTKSGYCPSYMKENINEIYSSYHQLNGNGMATSMIEELNKLPNKPKRTRKSEK
ncbi:MAG: hypothetical protein IKF19_05250 [Bacilli bacterium]|nr:hypothetical protein [Bacilli bacterium]